MAYMWGPDEFVAFETMNTDFFRPAVARGANFLDGVLAAREWRPEIDLSTLDLALDDCCVLGQLYGSYFRALDTLRIVDLAPNLGFVVPGSQFEVPFCALPRAEQNAWNALTETWRRELAPA